MLLGRELLAEVADFPCPACNAAESWSLSTWPRHRSNSVTAQIACRDCRERAFLKHVRDRSTGADEAQAEHLFATALKIRESFPTCTGFAVAAPWHRNHSTIVFQIAEGVSPLRSLGNAPEADALEIARRIGEWFALFHASLSKAQGPSSLTRTRDLEMRIAELSERWGRGNRLNAVAENALVQLQRRIQGLATDAQALVCLHGDAKPDNFLVSDRTVTGIDIDGRFWNEPEHDLAQFDTQLRLACTNLLGQFDSQRVDALHSATIAGYRRHLPISSFRLEVLRLWYLLQFWLSWRSPSAAHCWRWDRTFAAHVREIASHSMG